MTSKCMLQGGGNGIHNPPAIVLNWYRAQCGLILSTCCGRATDRTRDFLGTPQKKTGPQWGPRYFGGPSANKLEPPRK